MSPDCPYTMHGADVPAPNADLYGPDALAELRARLEEARRWAAAWKASARYNSASRKRTGGYYAQALSDRVGAQREAQFWAAEAQRLQRALASSNACCNRIQADGNHLADRLHEQATRLQAWREACRQYGIPEDPEALRAALRHLVSCVCVGDCDRRRLP